MSVKLPLILKRQAKPSPRGSPLSPAPSSPHEEEHYDEQFEDEDPVEEQGAPLQEQQQVKQAEPETFTALRSQQPPNQGELKVAVQWQGRKQQLLKLLSQKMQQAASLKNLVAERKREIKQVGEQIDRDLNKSLMRAAKPSTVSIRDIFSAPKSGSKRVNQLNEELKIIRIAIKKVKADIQKISDGMADPVSLLNQQKGIEFEARIKSAQSRIRQAQGQRDMLNEQIARAGQQLHEQEDKQRAEQFQKLSATLADVVAGVKECKGSSYQLDKEDILCMEKAKFFQERQGLVGQSKRNKPSEKQRVKIDEEIRQLILDINETIQQRNRAQGQKKGMLKALAAEVVALQAKNWQFCSKLRDIDSFLLQYYEKKCKRKEKGDKENGSAQRSTHIAAKEKDPILGKSTSGKVEVEAVETPSKTIEYDDKNRRSAIDVMVVQRKKSYEFALKQAQQTDVQLSDEFLGGKLNLRKIVLNAHNDRLLSIKASYSEGNRVVEGLVQGWRAPSQGSTQIQIDFDREKGQIISFIQVGFSEDQAISYLHLVSSEGKQHKWGTTDKTVRIDQKYIKNYESCFLKTRSAPIDETTYPISALTLTTFYQTVK